jgi:hypothetical protein
MTDLAFNLSFEEGYFSEEPRRCKFERKLILVEHSLAGLLARVDTPFDGVKYGIAIPHMSFVLVTPKFATDILFPIKRWPVHVNIYLPLIEYPEASDALSLAEIKPVGFGDLYLDSRDLSRPYFHSTL